MASALFTEDGKLIDKQVISIASNKGKQVSLLITSAIQELIVKHQEHKVHSIGIAVPGISRHTTGTVWAPNISGWEDYPLLEEVSQLNPNVPVVIESDRACCISGELWQGNARGCKDVIYLTVGTGIGAGILVNGQILKGAHDIGGAIGWMAMDRPFEKKFISCGCFEYYASGNGIAKVATEIMLQDNSYKGELRKHSAETITAHDVFSAYDKKDTVAVMVINQCIEFWGMAIANLVSLFDPEKIILGGGIFGPAARFIPAIRNEAYKWAQPISIKMTSIESSLLKEEAGLYGAAFLALEKSKHHNDQDV